MIKDTPRILVKRCKGLGPGQRGVYAQEDIRKGRIIELSPVMVIDGKEADIIQDTILGSYVFEWGDDAKSSAVGLGYVSMYNHSYEPNADYVQDFDSETIQITAVKAIKKGEEIQINYNADVNDKTPMWFEDPELVGA